MNKQPLRDYWNCDDDFWLGDLESYYGLYFFFSLLLIFKILKDLKKPTLDKKLGNCVIHISRTLKFKIVLYSLDNNRLWMLMIANNMTQVRICCFHFSFTIFLFCFVFYLKGREVEKGAEGELVWKSEREKMNIDWFTSQMPIMAADVHGPDQSRRP